MTEAEAKYSIDLLVETAKKSSTTMTLNLLSQYTSLYHHRQDDESLIKMNFCVLILLIKQGLFDADKTKSDFITLLRERELKTLMNDFKS